MFIMPFIVRQGRNLHEGVFLPSWMEELKMFSLTLDRCAYKKSWSFTDFMQKKKHHASFHPFALISLSQQQHDHISLTSAARESHSCWKKATRLRVCTPCWKMTCGGTLGRRCVKFISTPHRTRNEKMLEENVAKLADVERSSSSSGGQSGYRH